MACPWLDGKHTVFGKLVEGTTLLNEIESKGSSSGAPKSKVEITNCGEIKEEPQL